jgi:hypothetical protein
MGLDYVKYSGACFSTSRSLKIPPGHGNSTLESDYGLPIPAAGSDTNIRLIIPEGALHSIELMGYYTYTQNYRDFQNVVTPYLI